MAAGTVSGVYAAAVLACARPRGEAEAVAACAAALAPAFDAAMVQRIENPRLGRDQAKALLRTAASQVQAPQVLADFLCLLFDRHRLADAAAILRDVVQQHAQATGTATVEVMVPAQPSAAQSQRIVDGVRAAVGAGAQIAINVQPRLLGGLSVRHGDTVIDASVRRRLDDLSRIAHHVPVSDTWISA